MLRVTTVRHVAVLCATVRQTLWQVMENMRTVRLFNAQQRELARFQAHLDAEHQRTSRVAFLQGTPCICLAFALQTGRVTGF